MSDDDEYDSEEERMRERILMMQRRRHLQADAADQMDTLRRYRAEKEAASRVAAGAWQANLAANIGAGAWERDSDHVANSHHSDAAVIAAHEEQWKKFDAQVAASSRSAAASNGDEKMTSISFNQIPWPPFADNLQRYLLALTRVTNGNNAQADGNGSGPKGNSTRRAYAQAQLRYHPDKFQHKYGNVILDKDREKIMLAVHQVSQALNLAWAELSEEQDAFR